MASKRKYRLFLEGTVNRQYEPHPHAGFYNSEEKAVERAKELIRTGIAKEPIHIYGTMLVVSPVVPEVTVKRVK